MLVRRGVWSEYIWLGWPLAALLYGKLSSCAGHSRSTHKPNAPNARQAGRRVASPLRFSAAYIVWCCVGILFEFLVLGRVLVSRRQCLSKRRCANNHTKLSAARLRVYSCFFVVCYRRRALLVIYIYIILGIDSRESRRGRLCMRGTTHVARGRRSSVYVHLFIVNGNTHPWRIADII